MKWLAGAKKLTSSQLNVTRGITAAKIAKKIKTRNKWHAEPSV